MFVEILGVIVRFHYFSNLRHKNVLLSALGEKSIEGVYFFFDANMIPIYIGRSKDLKTRLTKHRLPPEATPQYLGIIATGDSHVLESQHIAQFSPKFNILQR